MPLITNNLVIIPEEGVAPPPTPVVQVKPVTAPAPIKKDSYHVIKDESLERIYNKKSPYLVDMIAIDTK